MRCSYTNLNLIILLLLLILQYTVQQVIVTLFYYYRYFAGLIIGCLQGVSKEDLLSSHYCPLPGYWDKNPLVSMMGM